MVNKKDIHTTLYSVIFWASFCSLLIISSLEVKAQYNTPDSARVLTEDIPRFWNAFDKLEEQSSREDSLVTLFSEYYAKASPGLIEFIYSRIGTAFQMLSTIDAHPRFYASIRNSTLRISSYTPEIKKAYEKLENLYKDAVFPDTYVVIGRMNSGGTLTDDYLLIGAEMYGKTPEMPMEELSNWHKAVIKPVDDIPHIIAHELIHFQQDYPDNEPTLLSQSIGEGSADFIAVLISGKHINEKVHEWADPKEAELWKEFKDVMHTQKFDRWLYNANRVEDRPADLGYWMGYKIVESYYEQAKDKKEALKDILKITDFSTFLKKSRYPEKFDNCD